MIKSVGSINFGNIENPEAKENKPVNIVTRFKAQNAQFKDAYVKSDDATKSKVNSFLSLTSVAGVLAMLAGHKRTPVRLTGAILSILASVASVNLNFNKNSDKNTAVETAAPEEIIPEQSAAPALSPAEVDAMNLIAKNDGAKPSPVDIFKQTTQG